MASLTTTGPTDNVYTMILQAFDGRSLVIIVLIIGFAVLGRKVLP